MVDRGKADFSPRREGCQRNGTHFRVFSHDSSDSVSPAVLAEGP